MAIENLALVHYLIGVTGPWRALFNQVAAVEMAVVGVHVLSMFVAGGLAISHDRGSLRAARWPSAVRDHHAVELHAVHRVVVAALTICMASGLALFAADVKTFVVSVPFWIKMALIAGLLVNALMMTASEASLRVEGSGTATLAWSRVRTSSIVSIALWASIVLVSIVLSLSK
jgi:hypothetical protein